MKTSNPILSAGWVTLGLILSLAVLAGCQLPANLRQAPSVNLRNQDQDPETQDILFVGSVVRGKELTSDVAICHAAVNLNEENGSSKKQTAPVLVAYVKSGLQGTDTDAPANAPSIYTSLQSCAGTTCTRIDIYVDDHNALFVPLDHIQGCSDPHGILKHLDRNDLSMEGIADLAPNQALDLTIVVHNAFDAGTLSLGFLFGDTFQSCAIPADHQHVRYGLGRYGTPRTRSSEDLYVCSAGVLVCTIARSFMVDSDNNVAIVGNDLNNTIMPAGIDRAASAGYCKNAVSGRIQYRIGGWYDEWRAQLRLLGEAGHDWIIGGPATTIIYGGSGNDLLLGSTADNYIYGEAGLDVMHGGQRGLCSGGSPAADHDCASGDPSVRWWPYDGAEAGDCCCHSCTNHEGCVYSDITPGATDVDVPPVPW